MRRLLLVALAALAALVVVACEPMEIGLTVHRTGTLGEGRHVAGAHDVSLSGTVSCTRAGEPLDFFLTVTQWDPTRQSSDQARGKREGVVRCSEEWSDWSLIFALSGDGLEPGSALVRLLVCTNPGERIDEDCVTVERGVTLS
jgi:hypothetical protein